MLRISALQPQVIQVSAWVTGDPLSPGSLVRHVLQDWGAMFDADPVVLPMGGVLEGQFPSVIVESTTSQYRLEIADRRITIIWRRVAAQAEGIESVATELQRPLVGLLGVAQVTVGRVAIVVNWAAEDKLPVDVLARQFFREDKLGGPGGPPRNFEVHVHNKFELLASLTVNSWVRIRTGEVIGQEHRNVFVQQDINTLAEELETRNFSPADMSAFFTAATTKMPEVLSYYVSAKNEE